MEKQNRFIVTIAPHYMNQGLDELRELDKSLEVKKVLEPGILLIETLQAENGFQDRMKDGKPIFVRHMHSVDFSVPINPVTGIEALTEAFEGFNGKIGPGEKAAIQVRKGGGPCVFSPMELKTAGDAKLVELFDAIPEIKNPDKIISIFLDGESCHMGLGTPEDNLSGWNGGMIHYKKSDEDISRAKFKLLEAIEIFQPDMSRFKTALDLGAAPGGWTSVLLEKGIHVTAVDTGKMDPRLNRFPKYRIIKANVSELSLEEQFDLLTSDISWNPKHTAKLIINLAGNLREGGAAIVTLKLMGDKVRKTIREVIDIYRERFEVAAARQLFHNRDEITLYLLKKRR